MAFVKAVREKVWLKLLFNGASGSGKTYSALRVATGIAKKCKSGIAFISSEGSRTLYYSDKFDYDVLELDDYSPEGYIAAIDEAINAGYKVVIIDSISHEWQWLNDYHDKMSGNSFQNWGRLKPRHKDFMNKILHSPAHIICCARGKTEWVLEENDKGKKEPKKVGLGAEQDKQITYEFTLSVIIDQNRHIASSDKDNTGLFDGKYEVLTEQWGEKLYDWANSGEKEQVFKPDAKDPLVDDLPAIKKQIISKVVALGGQKNEAAMALLKEYDPKGNPNNIKDEAKAKELLEKLNNMQ